MKANTDYSGYSPTSPVILRFWEVVQAFSKEDRARLLQFVTGTSKVPLEGFSALQGISGSQKFQIHKAYSITVVLILYRLHTHVAAQIQQMLCQIEQLQTVIMFYRGDSNVSFEELEILKHKVSLLEASNAELQRELRERIISCKHLSRCALDSQVEKDKLIMKLEAVRNGKLWEEIESTGNEACKFCFTYVIQLACMAITKLEGDLKSNTFRRFLRHLSPWKIVTLYFPRISLGC